MATLKTLVSFDSGNGAYPYWGNGLIADGQGNLFGTTYAGGASGYGTVFEIAKTTDGYASAPTTLVSFNGYGAGSNGGYPFASLIADAHGNLFGTTEQGGANGYGTVFEIAKTTDGYASTPTTLVSFNGINGGDPLASLIADAHGNLFGTTEQGGANGYGTVFEIAKTTDGYASAPTTLVSFNGYGAGSNGGYPFASLIADAHGNLFGTTEQGGANGYGTVFEIAKTTDGYASAPTTLVSFNGYGAGSNGGYPVASLIADAHGNLFGTTEGGGANGYGTVFEIAKTTDGYASAPTTLVSFNGYGAGSNGGYPVASLIADAHGNLFGTTEVGGSNGYGTVFEIAKTTDGYASAPTTLVSFNGYGAGSNGGYPVASLIADAHGNLFGTTEGGGPNGYGTVFEIVTDAFEIVTDVPPTIAQTTPSVVEMGQSTVIGTVTPGLAGDTLTLTQTTGTGSLALGAVQQDGTQQVIYTAPASVFASTLDAVSYTVIDQHNDALAQGSASVQLDAGAAITAATPSVVEMGQSTVIGTVTPGLAGDTLTLTQTTGTGSLALGAVQQDGTQQVIYTAPASVFASTLDAVSYTVIDQHNDALAQGSASVQLDAGAAITAATPSVVEMGQSTVIGTVTPGLAGDTLTLTQTTGTGSLALGAVQQDGTQQVIYTAPASVFASTLDAVSYTVADQHNDAVAQGSASVQLDAGPTAGTLTKTVKLGSSTDLTAAILGTVTPGLAGDQLTLMSDSVVDTLGSVSLTGGQLAYTANGKTLSHIPANGSASDSFSYTVADQHGGTATGIVKLTVTNPAATINGSPYGGATIQGTAGADIINASGYGNTIYDNGGNDVVNAGQGQATVYTGTGDVVVHLSGYSNVVSGGNGNVTISGSQGNTSVTLGDGDDSISVGGSSNTVRAGNGNDVVSGIQGNSIVTLGNGNNQVTAGGYSNQITTGQGKDVIVAGDGNDTVSSGGGDDTITIAGWSNLIDAGTGTNTVFIKSGGNDTFMLHTAGSDRLSGFSTNSGHVLDLRQVLSEASLNLGGSFARLGSYLHVSNTGGNASLLFDATGQWTGGGASIAVLQNVGASVSSLTDLTSHNTLRIS